jgi:hypothetical protein
MPVGAVILVQLPKSMSIDPIVLARERLPIDLQLVLSDDFYSAGPLVPVQSKNEGPIPFDDSDSQWFNLNLVRAFYSEEYKRGDPVLLLKCIEWIERHIAGCRVWYGNDITDDSIQLVDENIHRLLRCSRPN